MRGQWLVRPFRDLRMYTHTLGVVNSTFTSRKNVVMIEYEIFTESVTPLQTSYEAYIFSPIYRVWDRHRGRSGGGGGGGGKNSRAIGLKYYDVRLDVGILVLKVRYLKMLSGAVGRGKE